MPKSNETGTTASPLLLPCGNIGATPFSGGPKTTRSPIFPRREREERGEPRRGQIIFFVYFNSRGVKCLTCLTTTTPSPYRSDMLTQRCRQNVSTSRQRDASHYHRTARGTLFTSRQNDVLQGFAYLSRYVLGLFCTVKSPPQFILNTQKKGATEQHTLSASK